MNPIRAGARPTPNAARAVAIVLAVVLAALLAASARAAAPERGAPAGPAANGERAPSGRIVGGQPASTATYTWQAAVVLDEGFGAGDFAGQFCGGSLITPRIVLTAGHCVVDTDPDCDLSPPGPGLCLSSPPRLGDYPGGDGTTRLDPNDANVVLGRDVLSSGAGEEIDLQAVYLNADYHETASGTPVNDTAYLVLDEPSSQASIKLAGPGETALWSPGRSSAISGWGRTSESDEDGSDALRAATVGIIADATCGSLYGTDFRAASMLCAGNLAGGVDTCQGDSGGPLSAPGQDASGAPLYRLVGVTSWGLGCARANAPGVYARVGDGSPLHATVVAQVAAIENAQGLVRRSIVGSGAQPPAGGAATGGNTGPGGGSATPPTQTNKCKQVKDKLKRKLCNAKRKCRNKADAKQRKQCARKAKRAFKRAKLKRKQTKRESGTQAG